MTTLKRFVATLALLTVGGCATTAAPPLAYLSLEKPKGVIRTVNSQDMRKEYSRGGWYFWNDNFRPAADIQGYLRQAQKDANAAILRNVDVQLNVPVAFDILFFGYNHADDALMIVAEGEVAR